METFISWSGARSKAVAEAIRIWLPKVIQSAKPWMSGEDIAAGARWLTDVSDALNSARVGIVCVTPENQHNPWLLFEAGALSKTVDQTRVCVLTFDMSPGQISSPLSQFQTNELNRAGIENVLRTVNNSLDPGRQLDEQALQEIVEVWWPKLEERILAISAPAAPIPVRRIEDQLEELLMLGRENLRRENIRMEGYREREERSDEILSMMERMGAAINLVDSQMKKFHLAASKMTTVNETGAPFDPNSEMGKAMLSLVLPQGQNLTEIGGMLSSLRGFHERDKVRTEEILNSAIPIEPGRPDRAELPKTTAPGESGDLGH